MGRQPGSYGPSADGNGLFRCCLRCARDNRQFVHVDPQLIGYSNGHMERGKEDDHFTPSQDELAQLLVMFKDFDEFNKALAKDMPKLPKL